MFPFDTSENRKPKGFDISKGSIRKFRISWEITMVIWSLSPVAVDLQFSEWFFRISLEIKSTILEGEIHLS